MGVTTERFIRKPLYVDAVRVKADNFDEIVRWCQAEVQTDEVPGTGTTKKYIKVRVHNPKNPRQTKAFIGDWILYTDRGYKVYTNKAFRAAFDLVEGVEPKVQEMPPELDSSSESDEGAAVVAEEEPELATAEQIREGLPQAQDRRPRIVEDVKPHDVSAVAEEPSQETGVQPIESVSPTTPPQDEVKTLPVETAADEHTTPQGEPHEYVEATPEAIADAVNEQQPEPDSPEESTPLVPDHTPVGLDNADADHKIEQAGQPEPVSEQAPEDAAAGKRVLSMEEQRQMGPDAVREMVRAGDAILSQDLAESA